MAECNVENRTIFCDDNMDVMQGINSECVDLIYLDPPFNKDKTFTAPIGTSAEGASFKDIFREEDLKEEWLSAIKEDHSELYQYLNGIKGVGKSYNFAYLAYMAIRLVECRRVLKKTGSIYLHCDPTMSHYLKTTLDCIFGESNFRNEIIWLRKQGEQHNLARKRLPSSHDVIFWYGGSPRAKYNIQYTPYSDEYIEKNYKYSDSKGKYSTFPCTNDAGGNKEYTFRGIRRAWRFSAERMQELHDSDMLVQARRDSPFRYKKYLDENAGVKVNDIWTDIPQRRNEEYVGYPTQKPVGLLERIIKASSNEDDIILDPFCGCATTCVAAERLSRQWIGIDISIKAYELVNERLVKEAADPNDLFKYHNKVHMRTDPPKRTDQNTDYRETKFVYVISHPNYPGEFKVGIAKNCRQRLNSYQTSDPDRQYRLEYKRETPWFRETESHVHEKLENKHEWVKADLKTIIREIEGYKPAE